MKKKLLALILALSFCLALAACSTPNTSTSAPDASTTSQGTSSTQPTQKPQTATESKSITITLPAEYLGDTDTNELLGTTSTDVDVTKNEDGSVTLTMTQAQHEALLSTVSENLVSFAADSFPDDNFPSVKSMTFSEDFSEATLTVDYASYEAGFDALTEYSAIMSCGIYQIIAGTAPADVTATIYVVDEGSGETMKEAHYPDDYDALFETDTTSTPEETFSWAGKETGAGSILLSTEGGTSENGNVPVLFVAEDDILTQIGLDTQGLDGSHLSYIYIDGVLNTKEQLADAQMTLDLSNQMLEKGQHKVEVVQYDTDEPDGEVVTYKNASYEVKAS